MSEAVGVHMTIGRLARRADCGVETVRYYERSGLMPKPPRTAGGYRMYDEAACRRLHFIRRCRELGFPQDQVRGLLHFVDTTDYTCGDVQAMTLERLSDVRGRIADLRKLESVLAEMADQCEGGDTPDCPVIDRMFGE